MNRNYTPFSEDVDTYFREKFGNDWTEKYDEYLHREPAEYIRVNRLQFTQEELTQRLFDGYGIKTKPHETVPDCLVIEDEQGLAGKTIEHILGGYYIQSLSSMIPPLVLDPKEDERILDLCAAPGSKSTQIAALMNNRGTLVCNEIASERVKSLAFNLERMNVVNTGVVHGKGELLSKTFHSFFDKILVDVPCSGLGVMQKKGEINKWWDLRSVDNLTQIQYRLLVSAGKMLKEEGELVYSTCTLTLEENEQVLESFLKKYPFEILPVELPLPSGPGIPTDASFADITKTKRLIPWEVNSEGFFVARLKKTAEFSAPEDSYNKSTQIQPVSYEKVKKGLEYLTRYFGIEESNLKKYRYINKGLDYFIVDGNWESNPNAYYNKVGLKLGSLDKYGNFILSSISAQLLTDYIKENILDLTAPEALQEYMSGGTVRGEFLQKGQAAVRFRGKIIGTATVTEQGLKSRFPRTLRTQKMVFPAL